MRKYIDHIQIGRYVNMYCKLQYHVYITRKNNEWEETRNYYKNITKSSLIRVLGILLNQEKWETARKAVLDIQKEIWKDTEVKFDE